MKFKRKQELNYIDSFQETENVKFLRSGREYFNELIQLINAAKSSLHLQMYILNDDEIGNKILEALIYASQRKIEVYVVADAFGSNNLTDSYVKKLNAAGINFRFFARISLFRNLSIGRRMHHKIVVADRRIALVGGVNIADKYWGPGLTEAWLDFAVRIEGSVCEKLQKICYQIEEKKYYLQNTIPTTESLSPGNIKINIRQNDWLRNKQEIYRSYMNAIRSAEKSIIIFASYFLPGLRLRLALEAASKRGVQIILVLPGISDIPIALNATYYLYHWLFKHKIRIFEWKKSVLHAKIALVDDEWMTVGSFNLNVLSTYASIESNVDIFNSEFVIETKTLLIKIIEEGCEEITNKRVRSFLIAIREFVAYILGRSLIKIITFFPTFKNFYSKMVD